MKTFPKPLYKLGPRPTSLVGTSDAPQCLFLDAAAINELNKVFPVAPTARQSILLSSLFASTKARPLIIVTTPLEVMLLDHIKETPENGKVVKPKIKDFVNLGYGNLVVASYPSMRTAWYLYQPFILEALDTTPFKFEGSSVDLTVDNVNVLKRPAMLSPEIDRMHVRLDGFSECAQLLKSHLPDCSIDFALLGIRMNSPEVHSAITQRLGPWGETHTGVINFFDLFSSKIAPPNRLSAYVSPSAHPSNVQTTFTRPAPNRQDLRMDIRSIRRFPLPKRLEAGPNKVIYLAFDTNAHSRLHGPLLDLTSRLGKNIRLISLPTVAKELARGRGHQARERSLKSFLTSHRSKAVQTEELQFRPIPAMSYEGSISTQSLEADNRIRSEITLVTRRLVQYNPGREVYFVFVTFDVGCHLLCQAIDAGGVRLLLPKVDKRDIGDAGRVISNVLHPLLA